MSPTNELIKYYERYEGETAKSLRNFSKFLDIDPSTVSKILAGKRKIPKSKAISIAEKIFDNENMKSEFVFSIINSPTKKKEFKDKFFDEQILDQEAKDMFQIISQWEFFAILNILKVKNFDHSVEFIANSLGISIKRTKYCLEILNKNQFIAIDNGKYKRLIKKLNTTHNVMSRALQLAHQEELKLAEKKVDIEVDRKDYQSNTFLVSMKNLPKLKKIINKMYDQIDQLLEEDKEEEDIDEIYILSSQLFPISNCNGRPSKKELH